MRTSSIAGLLLASLVAVAAYGCTLDVSGAKPTTSSIGGAGPSSVSASSGQAGGAGGMAASVSVSSVATTGTGCVPATEVCNDNVDNDCNGMTDCEDPACTAPNGYSCSPAAPAGWMPVSFHKGGAACPAGFPTQTPLTIPNPNAPSTCNCACGDVTSNPCTTGDLQIDVGSSCSYQAATATVTGNCDALSMVFTTTKSNGKATPLPVNTTVCGPGTTTLPAPGDAAAVSCSDDLPGGGGCGAGAACRPVLPAAETCIQQAGPQMCPAPFTTPHVTYATADVVDNRMCDACNCAVKATKCNNPTLEGYENQACNSSHKVSEDVDGMCNPGGSVFTNIGFIKYSASPDIDGCGQVGPDPAVKSPIQYGSAITICCLP